MARPLNENKHSNIAAMGRKMCQKDCLSGRNDVPHFAVIKREILAC